MKIFGFIKQSSAAKFIITDILSAFQRAGCEILFIDFDIFINDQKKNNFNNENIIKNIAEKLADIKEFAPDIIITYGIEIFTKLFEELGEMFQFNLLQFFKDKPIVCFLFDFGEPFTNNINSIDKIPLIDEFQNYNVLYYVWDREAIKILNNCGIINTRFFPMAVNEQIFFIKNDITADRDKNICFIGGPTPERIATLEYVADLGLDIFGYDISVWNNSPKLGQCFRRPLRSQAEVNNAYNEYNFSINITRPHGYTSLNMRIYESIICGAVMLTDDKADIDFLFKRDEEILVYENPKQLPDIINRYLNNKNKLLDIRRAGYECVLKKHTYIKRIIDILPELQQFKAETLIFNKLQETKDNKAIFFNEFLNALPAEKIKINKFFYYYFALLFAKNNGGYFKDLTAAKLLEYAQKENSNSVLLKKIS